jgi:hypothetical protein
MKYSQPGHLAMRRSGRYRKPFGGERQVERLSEIEIRVVAQTRREERCRVAVTLDRKLAGMQGSHSLTGAIRDAHREMRRSVVKDYQDERRPGFWVRMDVVREMAPDDLSGGRLRPPRTVRAGSMSMRLDRTERALPCGTRILIWRACESVMSGKL